MEDVTSQNNPLHQFFHPLNRLLKSQKLISICFQIELLQLTRQYLMGGGMTRLMKKDNNISLHKAKYLLGAETSTGRFLKN
jgi:hypothetical protein